MHCTSAWKALHKRACARPAEPLARRTSFRIGGPADLLARPANDEELAELVRCASGEGLAVRVLGGGSNLLVSDEGVDGVVIELRAERFRRVTFDGNRVRAAAGANLARLVHAACRRGLGGLVALAGIPGAVGGALRMNAGGKCGEVGEMVSWIDVLEPDGTRRRLSRTAAGFRYRGSDLRGRIILGCEFNLPGGDTERLLSAMRCIQREKQAMQPLAARSAGCVFKNPPGDSAGRLIDRLGFRGRRRGGAVVSGLHANFIVNHGMATSRDVLGLAEEIRRAVFEAHGIALEYEIEIWRRAA